MLRRFFEKHRDRPFVMVEPGGNQGDEMIYRGAYKLADQVGLKYTKARYPRGTTKFHVFREGCVVYMHGGGGFAPWWSWAPRLLKTLRKVNPDSLLCVGPSTWMCEASALGPVTNPARRALLLADVVFARERVSYESLDHPDLRIDHDTALQLTLEDYPGVELRDSYDLLALRSDEEAGVFPDLPKKVYKTVDPCLLRGGWLRCHAGAASITTNRSHSAILGAILNKDTTLFAGRYHKNHSIWEYSLKDLGVKWIVD